MKSGLCLGCKRSALLCADYCFDCERLYHEQYGGDDIDVSDG